MAFDTRIAIEETTPDVTEEERAELSEEDSYVRARFYIMVNGAWQGGYANTMPEAVRLMADAMEQAPSDGVEIIDRAPYQGSGVYAVKLMYDDKPSYTGYAMIAK